MIFIFPFFCILNLILMYFNKFNTLYYITFFEGLLLLLLLYKLSTNNIFHPFKKNVFIDLINLKYIKIYLFISSLIFLISSPLYIFNILFKDTSLFVLGAVPVLFSGLIFSKLRRYNKIGRI